MTFLIGTVPECKRFPACLILSEHDQIETSGHGYLVVMKRTMFESTVIPEVSAQTLNTPATLSEAFSYRARCLLYRLQSDLLRASLTVFAHVIAIADFVKFLLIVSAAIGLGCI